MSDFAANTRNNLRAVARESMLIGAVCGFIAGAVFSFILQGLFA